MENRCLLCGCKTDALDLTKYKFKNGAEANVCGFCKKQLLAFNKNPESNALWVQQLLDTDTKGVRPTAVEEALRLAASENQIAPAPEKQAASVMPKDINFINTANNQSVRPLTKEEEFAIVKKQLADLQKDFKSFKKRYYLSKILGIVLPVVMVVLLFVILLATGAFENILNYYEQIKEWANY